MAKTKLNETIFKAYRDAINNRMKAGHDVSDLTKRLNKLIAQNSNQLFREAELGLFLYPQLSFLKLNRRGTNEIQNK